MTENMDSYIVQMDTLNVKNAHELRIQEERTKQLKVEARSDTKETIMWVLLGLLAAAVFIFLAGVWFTDIGDNPAQQPKLSDSQVEQQREQRCTDSGGGWLPSETFSSQYPEHGMCIYPGKPVAPVESQG